MRGRWTKNARIPVRMPPLDCSMTPTISQLPNASRMTRDDQAESTPYLGQLARVCVFSSHSFWTSSSLDVPAGVTQEEGHTGFLIRLLSAVRALIFLARRIQPFLSLVDCESRILCTNDLIVLHPLGIFILVFSFFSEKKNVCRGRTHVPTCQRVTRYV